jgi:NADH-quinone oxidoreductase subunit E
MTLEAKLEALLGEGQSDQRVLIALLQKVQGELGYVPEEAIYAISARTGVPASEVFGLLTFYAQFRLKPQGRNAISLCQGTACHVLGSAKIMEALETHLGVQPGDTTFDRVFTLNEVRCLGSCSLGPAMVVNGDTYGRLTPERAIEIVEGYREDAANH